MYCSKCGNWINENDAFCSHCGKNFIEPNFDGENRKKDESGGIYCVQLRKTGYDKVKVIKIISDYTGLGLQESKTLCKKTPVTLLTTSNHSLALEFEANLQMVGADAFVEPMDNY